MRCALVPENPNPLMPAIRGRPLRVHGMASSSTRTGSRSHGMCGEAFWKFRCFGSSSCSSDRMTLISPAIPAAASRCPMFVFTDPISSGRSASRPAPTPHRRPALRSDRPAMSRSRAPPGSRRRSVRYRRSQCLGDDPLLRSAVRHRQATRCAVLVHRAAPDHGPNPITVADGVVQPFHHDDAAALATHVAIGGRVERLAPAVRRQHVGPREVDHRRRADQQVHPAGQGEVALAQPQRLARLMDRHQRRTTCGVDRDRRTQQPHPVTDPAGSAAADVPIPR